MILQRSLPYAVSRSVRLPGTRPLGDAPWLLVDDAFAAQMAEREALLRDRRDAVVQVDAGARPAVDELLAMVLAHLPGGYRRHGETVTRPDGVSVPLDADDAMGTLTRLVQEDLLLLEKRGGPEHLLTAASLCFPSRWRLSDKFMRPLGAIHDPVRAYDDAMARRVQRLCDGLQVGRPIWRYNTVEHDTGALFQPEPAAGAAPRAGGAGVVRSERQVLMRLPRTRAVVFSIHTFVLRPDDMRRAEEDAGPRDAGR
ncbi:heme-dependent oxidative N-demethylase family protein [Roseivivax sp. CAU 1753]